MRRLPPLRCDLGEPLLPWPSYGNRYRFGPCRSCSRFWRCGRCQDRAAAIRHQVPTGPTAKRLSRATDRPAFPCRCQRCPDSSAALPVNVLDFARHIFLPSSVRKGGGGRSRRQRVKTRSTRVVAYQFATKPFSLRMMRLGIALHVPCQRRKSFRSTVLLQDCCDVCRILSGMRPRRSALERSSVYRARCHFELKAAAPWCSGLRAQRSNGKGVVRRRQPAPSLLADSRPARRLPADRTSAG